MCAQNRMIMVIESFGVGSFGGDVFQVVDVNFVSLCVRVVA